MRISQQPSSPLPPPHPAPGWGGGCHESEAICIVRWQTAPWVLPLSLLPRPTPNHSGSSQCHSPPGPYTCPLGRVQEVEGPGPSLVSARGWSQGRCQTLGACGTHTRALCFHPHAPAPSGPAPQAAAWASGSRTCPVLAPRPCPRALGGRVKPRVGSLAASPSGTCLRRSLPLPLGAGRPPPRSQRAWGPVRARSPWPGQLGLPSSLSPAGSSAPHRPEASGRPGPSASPGGCTFRLCPELAMATPLPVHQPGPSRRHLLPRPMQSPPRGSPGSAVTPHSLFTSGSQVTLGPSSAQTPHDGPVQRQSHSPRNGQPGPEGPALPPPPRPASSSSLRLTHPAPPHARPARSLGLGALLPDAHVASGEASSGL